MARYPDIEDLDAGGIASLETAQISALVPDLVWTLSLHAGTGMLDGTLELMGEEDVAALKAALEADRGDAAPPGPAHLWDRLEDSQLQELSAAVFARAAGVGDEAFAGLAVLDPDYRQDIAMVIEDWQTRYQPDEAEEDEIEP